jgi:long-chain acyl-CoA synthetase
LKQYAAGSGIAAGNDAELAGNEKVRALIEGEVVKACEGLAQYERVKKVYVVPREFSLEDGEVTPTMKVKRKAVEQHFKAEIDKLYA